MNWHKFFHWLTKCEHVVGYTEWKTRRMHGEHSPIKEEYRYGIASCCHCGGECTDRERVEIREVKT